MKFLLGALVFLLPLHALIVTTLKCKFSVDTTIIRFWKEIIILFFLLLTIIFVLKKNKYSFEKIYKNNYLIGTITAFIISSLIYLFFPFFEFKVASFLGFRYDVFFLFAFIIGYYLPIIKNNIPFIIKTVGISTFLILAIFLPWYLFGDIGALAYIFGYSSEVSTYIPNNCISFSQNVEGQHRFQATFGGPIRFSVFLVTFFSIFLGYILSEFKGNNKLKYTLLGIGATFVVASIFFSYSKTSILGLVLSITIFVFLVRKILYKKTISRLFISIIGTIITLPIIAIAIFKAELFLHLGAIINRLDNLQKSIEMFFYNPFGYGLGIAGPASQIGNSIESAGSWQIAASTVTKTHKFLPENWYVQILLEQGIIGLSLFISVLIIIWIRLYKIVKIKRDYMSIGVLSAFLGLLFMANFTHGFEESATSYILFLILGAYIALYSKK